MTSVVHWLLLSDSSNIVLAAIDGKCVSRSNSSISCHIFAIYFAVRLQPLFYKFFGQVQSKRSHSDWWTNPPDWVCSSIRCRVA